MAADEPNFIVRNFRLTAAEEIDPAAISQSLLRDILNEAASDDSKQVRLVAEALLRDDEQSTAAALDRYKKKPPIFIYDPGTDTRLTLEPHSTGAEFDEALMPAAVSLQFSSRFAQAIIETFRDADVEADGFVKLAVELGEEAP